MKKLFILIMCLFLFGCGEATLDGSSEAAFESSMEKMIKSLPEKEKQELGKAMIQLALADVDFSSIWKEDKKSKEEKEKENKENKLKMMKRLNGMTAAQVIAEANRLNTEKEEKRKQVALEREVREKEEEQKRLTRQIQELKNKEKKAQGDKVELEKFKIVSSKFYYQKSSFTEEAIIDLQVKNNTKHPISRVYCNCILSSPGRAIPWVKDGFNYKIPGGLEPGETAQWKLAPSTFGEWGKAPKDRKDLVLSVIVRRLDGKDDKALFGEEEFDEDDKKKLEDLQRELTELEQK